MTKAFHIIVKANHKMTKVDHIMTKGGRIMISARYDIFKPHIIHQQMHITLSTLYNENTTSHNDKISYSTCTLLIFVIRIKVPMFLHYFFVIYKINDNFHFLCLFEQKNEFCPLGMCFLS